MAAKTPFVLIIAFMATVTVAVAAERPQLARDGAIIHGGIHGGNAGQAKAAGDTINLMGPAGSGVLHIGDFEAGWNGWTTVDVTRPTSAHWQVSEYNQAVAGNLAAWCGDIGFDSCNDSLDAAGGYGNSWHDLLVYRQAVNNPAVAARVDVVATLQNDTEPGYDYTYLSAQLEGQPGYWNLRIWDGTGSFAVNDGHTYLPAELIDGSDVVVAFRVMSDPVWSDEDCSWPSQGACQIDDITVTVSQAGEPDLVTFDDFQDGSFGNWSVEFPSGVGDFSALWTGLEDEDPCRTNYSQQVAFIDDGLVVPGTGGSFCINWCYGPSGYIVNSTGGLAGPSEHIQINLLSPVMNWPDDTYDGVIFSFDAYRHEDLTADAPGIFFVWGVRSADTDGSEGPVQLLADQKLRSRNFVYYGKPRYSRESHDVTDLMNRGRDEIQVSLGVYELGWAWAWNSDDGYPAPYFDNVAVKVFPYEGPSLVAREIDLAQDNFPETDSLDYSDLGAMHVRFDMARNISPQEHLRNDPGDSIVIDIVPVRAGSVLAGSPELHYIINANPVFDPYRSTPTSGMILGLPAIGFTGIPDPDAWSFDLPDTGTLYPGDVLHYYIRAGDDVAGDVRIVTLPTDITGFGQFGDPQAYPSSFVVRALPSIAEGYSDYETPEMLFWNDSGIDGGEHEWFESFNYIGLVPGDYYDIYTTNGPTSGVGNGLGGRTDGPALDGYSAIVYTAGNLGTNTLANGDFDSDASDDLGVLSSWLSAGNRGLLLTGDGLVSDLVTKAGAGGLDFADNILGVDLVAADLRPFIGNQTTPAVFPISGNPVLFTVPQWAAYGGCESVNTFDAVTPRAGATRLAEFGSPSGVPGNYSYSAATLNITALNNHIISLPYDLMFVEPTLVKDRSDLLGDMLTYLGVRPPDCIWPGCPPVPDLPVFAVASYPNPFNPVTRIEYSVSGPGHLSLKIYNLRGELVRTLVDAEVQTRGHVVWDGTDGGGAQVASGVYFYEARMGGEVKVEKMALIK